MWTEHDKMLQNQNMTTYLLNFLNSTKGLCWGGFWKPWGWWKSRRWLCRHLRRKKMEEIKASHGNLHLCMSPAQKKQPEYHRLNDITSPLFTETFKSTSSKDLQNSSKLSYVKIPSSNRNIVSRSLHTFAETKLSANFKHYINWNASTCIKVHQHDPALQSTWMTINQHDDH